MGKYTVTSSNYAALANTHGGTGDISNTAWVVVPSSVQDIRAPLQFASTKYSVTVMSLEIATAETPNWFGVAFREGISTFNTVNIFCHPHPGNAQMRDEDYPSRSGNWPRLFRYVEMFGRQMDMAKTNHIVVVPFFTNASYGNTGLFGANWQDIIEQILVLAGQKASGPRSAPPGRARAGVTPVEPIEHQSALRKKAGLPSAATPAKSMGQLKDVVLSDFSRGRSLMWTVRNNSHGMSRYLREVWDFEGNAGPTPSSSAGVRGILYDQSTSKVPDPRSFHVPPERWESYHHAVVKNVHGNIPEMLAYHAASISSVG